MVNYLLMALGIFMILTATILIFLDKLKGEDVYFNLDVKEQEVKKVIEDADEIIAELNYTSEIVVKEIEDKLRSLREDYSRMTVAPEAPKQQTRETVPSLPVVPAAAVVAVKKKRITVDAAEKERAGSIRPNPKQQAVFDCSARGMSVMEIAKQLNMGQGEVMLILSLKNEVE